jgi:hypothetical protein
MNISIHQKHLQKTVWVLAAIIVLGSILDSISNAISLITPLITYITSAIVLVVIIVLKILMKKRLITWIPKGESQSHPTRLGIRVKFAVFGLLLLLWMPRIVDAFSDQPLDTPAIQIYLGNQSLTYEQNHDVVYGVPRQPEAQDFFSTYISLYIGNNSDKSVQDITITLRYPAQPRIAYLNKVNEQILGVKETGQLKRRSFNFESVDMSILSIDNINPGEMFILNEPISLPIELIKSQISEIVVAVDISAKDFRVRSLYLTLRCFAADSFEALSNQFKHVAWQKAVANRKRSNFLNYLKQALREKRVASTLVLPSFQLATNSKNEHGYMSDAMHDTYLTVTYDPAPIAYLFK